MIVSEGLGLVESVRWAHGAVWFADWTHGAIHRVDPESGEHRVVAEVASLPLCFDLLGGELVALDSGSGWLLRGGHDEPLRRWIDVSAAGRTGNEVLAVGGRVYVNFGNFDPREGFPSEPVGSVAVVGDDGSVDVVAERLAFPNGMALADDGATLLVAESYAGGITAWSIAPDGGLADRRTWAAVPGSAPDGIGIMPDGSCWFADVGAAAVVRVREGGEVLERRELDRGAFSCVAAPERDTLYVAAAVWPGPAGLGDPAHDWDGQLLALPMTDTP
jgi:sugar lactone lactonase YvrE